MNDRNHEINRRADSPDSLSDLPNFYYDQPIAEVIERITEGIRNTLTFGPIGGSRPSAPMNRPPNERSDNRWSHFPEPPDGANDARPQLRPITKTSMNSTSGWYQQYYEQTQRFEDSNAKTGTKHVHFCDDPEDQRPRANGVFGKLGFGHMLSPITAMNELGFRFGSGNVNEGIARSPPGFGPIPTMKNENHRMNDSRNSLVDTFCNGLMNAATNCYRDEMYSMNQWEGNVERIKNSLANTPLANPLFGNSIWSAPSNENNGFLRFFGEKAEDTQDKVQQLFASFRKLNPKTPANYTWSGQLPRKSRTKTPIYSCKVFLGGIPYDLTDSDLHCTFAQFGHIQIQWPGKDIKSAIDGAAANKAGYVYIIFESYDNVAALLNHCTVSYRDMDSGCRWYFNISSRRQKGKEVQVIPFDIGDRFYMKNSFSGQMEHSRTVFVGALHGMLSADGLAKVMDDLFGGVVFAGLDTDKFKYPLGSGRVSFDNHDSYMKAVSAAFVEIKSARFKKKIQIDPYIENESMCTICRVQQTAPIFCRDDFLYFCSKCWDAHHSDPDSSKHRPIIKNKPSNA